jgi:hypothetical protein
MQFALDFKRHGAAEAGSFVHGIWPSISICPKKIMSERGLPARSVGEA